MCLLLQVAPNTTLLWFVWVLHHHAGQSNKDSWPALVPTAGSTSRLRLHCGGYFMEWNRTLGKTQNSSVTSNCSGFYALHVPFHEMPTELRWLSCFRRNWAPICSTASLNVYVGGYTHWCSYQRACYGTLQPHKFVPEWEWHPYPSWITGCFQVLVM